MNPETPKPNREEIEVRLTALLLGELPPSEAELLRWNIAQDTQLAQLHDRLKNAMNLVREVASHPEEPAAKPGAPLRLSDERRQKLLAHFKTVTPSEFTQGQDKPGRKTSWLLPLAAVLMVSAVLAAMLLPAVSRSKRAAQAIDSIRSLAPRETYGSEPASSVVTASLDQNRGVQDNRNSPVASVNYNTVAKAPMAAPSIPPATPAVPPPAPASASIYLGYNGPLPAGGPEDTVSGSANAVGSTFQERFDNYNVGGGGGGGGFGGGAFGGRLPQANAAPPASELARGPALLAAGQSSTAIDAPNSSVPSAASPDIAINNNGTVVSAGGIVLPSNSEARVPRAAGKLAGEGTFALNDGIIKDSGVTDGGAGTSVTPIAAPPSAGLPEVAPVVAEPPPNSFPEAPNPIGQFAVNAPVAPNSPARLAYRSINPSAQSSLRLNGVGRLDQAKEQLQAALKQNPNDATANYNLGLPQQAEQERLAYNHVADTQVRLMREENAWATNALGTRATINATSSAAKADRTRVTPTPDTPAPQPEVFTKDNVFSTFSLNVSDVSFKLAAASLEHGQLPPPAGIRSEEFINAFDYRDPEPPAGSPVGFAWERAGDPFAHNRDLLRFAIKTAAEGRSPDRPLNLVLLLDTSGSMERADRVAIIQAALRVLGAQLQPHDTLSVVTFTRTARLWVDGVPGNQAGGVFDRVGRITPEGGTNLEEAMKLAYATARRHFQSHGLNRVVLMTDGAANLGEVNPQQLKKQVETERQQGIALDCFGIGWEDYNDNLLEVLSSHGDGRYGFLNTPEAAATGFATQLAGALKVAAADVKVQVEFNPQRVTAWRQIGYAQHQLTKEQFRDNTVDAAVIGAAESGNALYTIQINPQGEGPVATVRVRFRTPGTADVQEHSWMVPYTGSAVALDRASPAMRLATVAGLFAEWLSGSPYAADVTPNQLAPLLQGVPQVYATDPRPGQLEAMLREAFAAPVKTPTGGSGRGSF